MMIDELDWRVRAVERFSGPLWVVAISWACVHLFAGLTNTILEIVGVCG